MFEDVIVPLAVAQALGQVKGKTRFQKIMFLVKKHAEREGIKSVSFDFEIYLYGPFSQELSGAIDNLVHRGYVDEQTEPTSAGYEMHVYRLSNKGEDLLEDARAKKLIAPEIDCIVSDVISKYGKLPLPQLVKEAYGQF